MKRTEEAERYDLEFMLGEFNKREPQALVNNLKKRVKHSRKRPVSRDPYSDYKEQRHPLSNDPTIIQRNIVGASSSHECPGLLSAGPSQYYDKRRKTQNFDCSRLNEHYIDRSEVDTQMREMCLHIQLMNAEEEDEEECENALRADSSPSEDEFSDAFANAIDFVDQSD